MPKTNLQVDNFQVRPNFPKLEEAVLDYWDSVDAFKKSVAQRPETDPYVFYDGPPFATGLPHYGHLLASTIKDVIPRYWTMKGKRVERIWGWDCHGLPIENIVEKELNLKGGKKGIESLGIDKFNDACRNAIWRFDNEWEKIIRRLGRWVDFKNSYKTMDTTFMESVWWAFKTLHHKGLVYQGRKVILYCPRCSTPLSNFEIAMDNSYKEVTDNSVIIKFKVKHADNEYLLAWTTTPWTLIGNVGLAVDPDEMYVKIKIKDEFLYLAKSRRETIDDQYEVVEEMAGNKLVGLNYEPLYNFLNIGDKQAHYVASGDFVSMDEGTGIVHTAAMYGEDDFQLALKINLPLVEMLDEQGKFMEFVHPLSGVFYKSAETWIMKDLKTRNLLYQHSPYKHSYPFCYRCETPLYYTGIPAWFIDIQKIKPQLIQSNELVNWYPDHLQHGRFGKGLESAPDWNISRSRYWGTPIPVWTDINSKQIRIIGSIAELQKWAVDTEAVKHLTDIHREFVDDIEIWIDDNKTIKGKRIPEVFDCWVESGSMPFASEHYPLENEAKFQSRHPAQFISEYIAQTRAWFYTLHVMSVALFGKHTFENALTTGTILAADGQKMSKSKKNYPDPMLVAQKYGMDSLRTYLMSSTVMKAENLNFNEKNVDEIRKKVFNIFWNVFTFYKLYNDGKDTYTYPQNPAHVLDKWLISVTQHLTKDVTQAMESYDVVTASRKLMAFVNDFSTWWLRLSRERLRDPHSNQEALQVFRSVLKQWLVLMAPFAPFFTEIIYQNLVTDSKESIHLELLPQVKESRILPQLETGMKEVQIAVEKIHAARKAAGIRVRQPLRSVTITSSKSPNSNLQDLLAQEVNVKKVIWQQGDQLDVKLDTHLTAKLLAEGQARELIRQIQDARKNAGTLIDEGIDLELPDWPPAFETEIKAKVLARNLTQGETLKIIRLNA